MNKLEGTENDEVSTSKKNILIVEDEYIIATDIAEKASKVGYKNCTITTSIEEATNYILKHTPDLVLLDISLNDGDGTSLAKNVLNPKQIPFIYITSYDEGIHFERAKKTKPYGFLSKPATKKELKNAIELALYKAENEDIKEILKEKEIVLKISEGVNKLRSISEFFSFVVRELKPIFDFHDVGVFLLNEDGTEHQDLASLDLQVSDSKWNQLIQLAGLKSIKHKNSAIEWMMGEIEIAKKPVLFDFRDLAAKFPEYPQLKVADILSFGYRDCLATNLKIGNRIFGMFCLNRLKKNAFCNAQISLFANITTPLSIAVDNVIANEKITEEKEFKETLLNISDCMSSIFEPERLFTEIFENIKPLFNFYDVGVYVLSEDGKKMTNWAVKNIDSTKSKGDAILLKHNMSQFNYSASVVEIISKQLANGRRPIVKKYGNRYTEEANRTYENTVFKNIIENVGYKEFMATRLHCYGKTLGVLYFNSLKENHFNEQHFKLFQEVADHIAVAISNIINHQEILKRERKKAFQLELGKQMSRAQNFESLLSVLFNDLNKCIPFSALSLIIWKNDTLILSQVLESKNDGAKDISKDFNQKFEKVFRKFKEENFEASLVPNIFTKNVIEKNKSKSTLLKVLGDFIDLNSMLQFHRKLNNETDVILQFVDNQRTFTTKDVREMEEYMSIIELSISNHLAFLDIEELNFKIKQEKEYLEAEIGTDYNFGELIGSSSKMKEIYRQISLAAPTDASVLITGETGTGKELVARAIHNISKRKNNSIVKINCAALPANLIESELFGHEKGAFTGATKRRIGKFELADKGTIFLDEIGEMPLEIQVKLLRVLQEKEFERVGGNLIIKVDVRVIAATNRNLLKEISDKNFREDLYYRLDVFPVVIPPLRDRKEDIPELALHFLQKKGQRLGKRITSISDQALRELMGYDFPGNVRELEHSIEQALITSKGNYLKLNLESRRKKRAIANDTVANGPVSLKTYEQGEIDLIMTTLKFTGGKVRGAGGAAEILEVHPNTLESKMRRLGIKRKHVLEIIENDEF